MSICIFCRTENSDRAREHVWPESFGGANWAVLPPGIVCSKCNNYIASRIEQPALESFPFKFVRSMFGIPTKKGRVSILTTYLGEVYGVPLGGRYRFRPSSLELDKLLQTGKKKSFNMVISTVPEAPLSVCRMVLKMGIEYIAIDDPEEALSMRFETVRRFVRFPKKGTQWSFALIIDSDYILPLLSSGMAESDWTSTVGMERIEYEGNPFFLLSFIGIGLMTPLVPNYTKKEFNADSGIRIYSVEI